MTIENLYLKIAIVGGGPTALYLFKRFVENGNPYLSIDIFEKGDCLGCGMPYSHSGAADEHITNVSGNEIPELVTSVSEWINTVSKDTLNKYNISPERFNEYKVLPRLLFGQYLSDQFGLLLKQARENGQDVSVNYNSPVADVIDQPETENIKVQLENGNEFVFDRVILCTGHLWPKNHEGEVKGWFDSPYPPQKISLHANHPVAVRGASLTAIDAVRTLARHNGEFSKDDNGVLQYKANADSADFRIVMHSRNGLLPAVRFHLEDTRLGKDAVLSPDVIANQRANNNGFLPLDFVFEENFKKGVKENDPVCYEEIKHLSMEGFVNRVMSNREAQDAFDLLKAEYAEAEKSIKKEQSIYWKEMLAILSFTMNYPAKYFSAEDMLRLRKTLMPLISVVIAFVPQSSAETLMALNAAGILTMVKVTEDEEPEPATNGGANYAGQYYPLFVDAIGQPPLTFDALPFPGLREQRTISAAKLRFRDPKAGQELIDQGNKAVQEDGNGNYYLVVPGLAINDNFQVLDSYNALNNRLYVMAVPFIGGYNPDYSGLDFSATASQLVVESMLGTALANN